AAADVQDVDGGVDDADVRLVRDVQVDVVGAEAGVPQHVLDGVAQDGDRPAEDAAAVHVHVVQAAREQLRRRRHAAAAGRAAEQVAAAAVGPHAVAQDALVRPAARQQYRPRPVAEQRVGLQVVGVDHARVAVAADDQGQVTGPGDHVGGPG